MGALYDFASIPDTGDTHPALFLFFASMTIPKFNDSAVVKDPNLWVTRTEAIDAIRKVVTPVAKGRSVLLSCKKHHGMSKFSPDSMGVHGLRGNGI